MEADIEARLREVELQMAAVVGRPGVTGWVPRIESEQARSAQSQGERIEKLRTWATEELAGVKKDLARTREQTIDTRARIVAMMGLLLGLIAVAGVLAKLLN